MISQGRMRMFHSIKQSDMKNLAVYQAELKVNPLLKYLYFELTSQCNLYCRHCGSGCTDTNTDFLEMGIISATLKSVAKKYGPSGIMICLTGGEPMLHYGVYDVISCSHKLGFPVGMTTNGTLINRIAAMQLAQAGLDTVAVSLDGMEATHDTFRNVRGSFFKAINGIYHLKSAGIEPQIITVVHKGNFHQLQEMYIMLQKMNIYSWRLVNIEPIGRAAMQPDQLLSADELKDLFEFIRNKRFDRSNTMEVTYGCSHFATFEYEKEIRDYYFQCGAGTFVASIMANGDIGACLDIERRSDLIQGNMYRDNFLDIWEKGFASFRKDRTMNSKSCRKCEYRSVCEGDSSHTWDYDLNEPKYCIAKGFRYGGINNEHSL